MTLFYHQLKTIGRLPNVSEAVSHDKKQEYSQGNPHHRSGLYNNYDTVSAPPDVIWPYEGFHGSNDKKRLLYDELSVPQWMAGQLTNILHMQDLIIAKQALVQVIAAIKDAVSIFLLQSKMLWLAP